MAKAKRPDIGDRIVFRSITRWNDKIATRIVNGYVCGNPTVRFGGWRDFVVRPDEIVAIIPKASA